MDKHFIRYIYLILIIFPIVIFSQEKVTIGKYTYEVKTSQYISKKDTFYNQELINIENNKKAFWCPLKHYYGTGKFIIDEKKRKIKCISYNNGKSKVDSSYRKYKQNKDGLFLPINSGVTYKNGIWTRSVFYNFEDYKKTLKKIYYEK